MVRVRENHSHTQKHNKNTKQFVMTKLIVSLMAMIFPIVMQGQISKKQYGDTLATSIFDGPTKIISVLGDSYVRNHRRPYEETWHFKSAMKHGLDYRNLGRNGGCVAFDRTKEGFGPSLMVRYLDLDPNSDIVLIIAGHNDAVKIGDDQGLLAQFTDSVRLLIDKIRTHCPKAKIGWVTPWYVDAAGFAPTCKAIKKICKQKKVALLDNYKAGCMIKVRDASFRSTYFQSGTDTAHLNANGHDLYLATGDKFVEKLLFGL